METYVDICSSLGGQVAQVAGAVQPAIIFLAREKSEMRMWSEERMGMGWGMKTARRSGCAPKVKKSTERVLASQLAIIINT